MDRIAKNNNLVGKHAGRPKGALNKTTTIAKDAISFAADALGGADRLVEWAKSDKKNEFAFWTSIYPKMLPLQLSGDSENPIFHRVINVISGRA